MIEMKAVAINWVKFGDIHLNISLFHGSFPIIYNL